MPVVRLRTRINRLVCSGCGAEASCDCGVPYVTPAERARAVLAETPQLSDRANAHRAGVSLNVVRRQRMPTEAAAEIQHQQTLYDQACLFLSLMTSQTRRRFFAHIERTYDA